MMFTDISRDQELDQSIASIYNEYANIERILPLGKFQYHIPGRGIQCLSLC